MDTHREWELNQLWNRYREACGSPDGGPNFMPGLWARIDGRRQKRFVFERGGKFLFAAAALSCAAGLVLVMPSQQSSVFNSESYVEAIATANTQEYGTFFAPVRLELGSQESGSR